VLDGGYSSFYRPRLGAVQRYIRSGLTTTPCVGVFGGQRLRQPGDNEEGHLETIAYKLSQSSIDPWFREWITQELAKKSSPVASWTQPFATEHEVGILSLLRYSRSRVEHIGTTYREGASSIHPSIPVAHVASEEFVVDDVVYSVSNAPAIPREHAGHKHPLSEARPNGRSVFIEDITRADLPKGASVLFVSHNPVIYRSWLDMVLASREMGRGDLCLDGAGAAIEPNCAFSYAARAVADLVINHYNREYEGGQNASGALPLTI
jgi:hypothetical protein